MNVKMTKYPQNESMFFATDPVNTAIYDYASQLSDREWLETILKSTENPKIDGIQMPGFPPEAVQLMYVGATAEQNIPSAFQFYSEVKGYAAKLGLTLTRDSRILDFGCGWGRIIRFFLKDTIAANLYGIDISQQMIDICQETVGYGNYGVVDLLPPTTFPDNSFDLIYAFSVFSHLPESIHIKWVNEFSRILKPDGLLIVTTRSLNFIEFCNSLRGKEHDSVYYNDLADSFVDRDAATTDYYNGKFLYSALVNTFDDPSLYGEAIIPPRYVEQEWTKYLKFHDFVDDPVRCPQSMIVMQKPKQQTFPTQLSNLQNVQANLERSQIRLRQIKDSFKRPQPLEVKQLNIATSALPTQSSAAIYDYASRLSDREWLGTILKSIENLEVDGIQMPGFPSEEIQCMTVGTTAHNNLLAAFNFYSQIKHYAKQLGHPIAYNTSILDFGCGWGRIIRFFLKDINVEHLHGIDVSQQMIDICHEIVRYGNYCFVDPIPPTSFPDQSFDIIYAYSVFSHLSEDVHIKWIEEFARILKPGGILIVTTQPRSFIEFCKSLRGVDHESAWYQALSNSFIDTETALADYDQGKFLYSSTGASRVLSASYDGDFYGEALIPPDYIKREWTRYLEFRDFVDDLTLCPQAIVVMQKPNQQEQWQGNLSDLLLLMDREVNRSISSQDEMHNYARTQIPNEEANQIYYFNMGRQLTANLLQYLISNGLDPKQLHILDFAAGYGRVTRWLATVFGEVTMADLEPSMIEFNQREFGVQGFVSTTDPRSLSSHQQNYDVIFIFSLFSHLPKSTWQTWLDSLARLVKPGGFLIFSTHSYELFAQINPEQFGDASKWVEEFLFWEDNETGGRLKTSVYGCSIVKESYVYKSVSELPGFELVRHYKKGEFDVFHDMYVIRNNNTFGEVLAHSPYQSSADFQAADSLSHPTTSIPLQGIEKLVWQSDRMLLEDLVFRIESKKDDNWELGEECFVLYKLNALMDSYKNFFSSHQDFNPQNVFELGMWEGGSVALWFEILQPQKYVAIDLRPAEDSQYFQKYVNSRGLQNRLKTYWRTNQADSQRLKEIVKYEFSDRQLDLVMDDASHLYEETKSSFETLFPLVRPGGFYIIEDWAWWHWQGFEEAFSQRTPLSQLIFELVEVAGTSRQLIKSIVIYSTIAIVERGTATVEQLGDFELNNYIYRHPR
jgi:SAM-dependent methyltransferase